MSRRSVLLLAVSILIPLGVGALGGWATAGNIPTWYASLAKPSFNPPSWVFGPVWTTLYLMMGVSLWLVWRTERTPDRDRALALFAIQLVLNLAWSFLFFSWERPDVALLDIVLLDIAIFATIHAFRRHARSAALLLIPYLMWCLFATVLNAAIWHLNP